MWLWLSFAPFLALLALAALTDLRERRIPNWLTGAIAALYPLYVMTSPASVDWPLGLAVASGVFCLGVALFAKEWIGGGDVKLIAAVTLWAGLEQLALFALVTTLAGGVLALISLALRRWGAVLAAPLAALGWSFALAGGPAKPPEDRAEADGSAAPAEQRPPITLPYGVAIAAGGCAVAIELMKL